MSRWLTFEQIATTDKTVTVAVRSARSGDTLGEIRWFGRWRQYAFFPRPETVWNPECLADVAAEIARLMAARRGVRPCRTTGGSSEARTCPVGASED